jgi:hypothetical protein
MNTTHFNTYGQLQTVITLCQTDSHYEIKYITTVLAPSTFAQVYTSQSMMGRVYHLSLVSGEKRRDGIAVSVRVGTKEKTWNLRLCKREGPVVFVTVTMENS